MEDEMNIEQWFEFFSQAFENMKRLEQVLKMNSCREHWIQAEISLFGFEKGIEIMPNILSIGKRRKADLCAEDDNGSPVMVAEIKCLGDVSQSKCLEGSWSIHNDISRLRSVNFPVRLFVLVIAKGDKETNTGRRLREDKWIEGPAAHLELGFAQVRMWAVIDTQ